MPGTRLVYVADREADMVAIMCRARDLETPVDWLVRAKHNRCLPDGDGDKLWAYTTKGEALGEITFTMGGPRRTEGAYRAPATLSPHGRDIGRQGRMHHCHLHRGARNRRTPRRQADRMALADQPPGFDG